MPLAAGLAGRAPETAGAAGWPLSRRVRRVFDRILPSDRGRDAGRVLAKIQQDLGGMGGSTEGVFLLVGARLAGLQAAAREIAAQTAAIAEAMSHDTDSLVVLDEVLTTAGEDRTGDNVTAAIGGIQESAKAIHRAIQGFGPLVKTFDVLGVMTRMESVRFEAAGSAFAGLADAVSTLSRQIREQIDATAGSAAVLLETTSRAAGQMRDAEQKHRENLGPLARQAGAEIKKMGEHRRSVSEATGLLAARFEDISRAVGNVVAALQSHDIVRQQVEHVVEALGRRDPGGSNLGEVARLQAAQLTHSRGTLETSVAQIRQALAEIERNIREVAGEPARLLGLSGEGAASFFSGVQADLAGILAILDSNAAEDQRLAEAAVSVHQRASGIAETIDGVRVIGIEMQRIALNATIQAAHLGRDGAALEIVAQAIQALARETENASGLLDGRLRAIPDGASALGRDAERGGADTEIAQLRRSSESLREIQQQAQAGHSRTAELADGLQRQIRETIEAFGTQSECLQVLAGAVEMLRDLSPAAAPGDSTGTEQMASIYTMQSERGVHQALYDAVPRNEPDAQEDNVEFF